MSSVIEVKSLTKEFKLPVEKNNSIKKSVINLFSGNKGYITQKALDNINFEINKGEFFGIVGKNGSGKSTLLKILAGIYSPSKGVVNIKEGLTPFIELGVGFNPELTGKENVYLNASLLGFSRKQTAKMYKSIVDFAELNKFMDQKLKNYSSGMQVRLAFSIAIRSKNKILLIDEVLAVGDAAFQTKCFDYFAELKKTDTTVVFVSHDSSSLERFCERGILIDEGNLIYTGKIEKVLEEYSKIVVKEIDKYDSLDNTIEINDKNTPLARLLSIEYEDKKNNDNNFKFMEKIKFKLKIKFKINATNPIIGYTIWKKDVNEPILAINSFLCNDKSTGYFKINDKLEIRGEIDEMLNNGEYYIQIGISDSLGKFYYLNIEKAIKFYIIGSKNLHSVISVDRSKLQYKLS